MEEDVVMVEEVEGMVMVEVISILFNFLILRNQLFRFVGRGRGGGGTICLLVLLEFYFIHILFSR